METVPVIESARFEVIPHVLYGLCWLSFGLLHSLLAAPLIQQRLKPLLGPYYRLAYNIVAVVHLGVIWVIGSALFQPVAAFGLPLWITLPMALTSLLGLGLMGIFLKSYDVGLLLGLSQIRAHRIGAEISDEESLHLDGPHRYIRHPLYLAGLLIVWGVAFTENGLATAVWVSLYFWIGSRHEERKLHRLFGPDYSRYQQKVPAFFPWRGRAWKEENPLVIVNSLQWEGPGCPLRPNDNHHPRAVDNE